MSRPVALVTGANRGLGLETSRALAERGYRVWMAARDPEPAARALADRGLPVSPVALDVTDPASIEACAARVERESAPLDALVNNAAVMEAGPDTVVAARTIATNVAGPRALTDRLSPRMGRGARVVMVSSGLGELSEQTDELRRRLDPPPDRDGLERALADYRAAAAAGAAAARGWPGSSYAVSKAFLNALTRLLAIELAPRGLLVNAVCPGWVQTRMGGAGAPRTIEEGGRGIVWAATLPPDGPTGGFFRDGQRVAW